MEDLVYITIFVTIMIAISNEVDSFFYRVILAIIPGVLLLNFFPYFSWLIILILFGENDDSDSNDSYPPIKKIKSILLIIRERISFLVFAFFYIIVHIIIFIIFFSISFVLLYIILSFFVPESISMIFSFILALLFAIEVVKSVNSGSSGDTSSYGLGRNSLRSNSYSSYNSYGGGG